MYSSGEGGRGRGEGDEGRGGGMRGEEGGREEGKNESIDEG